MKVHHVSQVLQHPEEVLTAQHMKSEPFCLFYRLPSTDFHLETYFISYTVKKCEVQLIYRIVLVSGVQQSDLVICTYLYLYFQYKSSTSWMLSLSLLILPFWPPTQKAFLFLTTQTFQDPAQACPPRENLSQILQQMQPCSLFTLCTMNLHHSILH